MRDRREIVKLWEAGHAETLVTLVRAEGSSYRRPGARLLTSSVAGIYAGTVSGGCLESEVVKRAAWKTRSGASVERYSMSFDDTAEIPFGLGCGGTVDLLFEPAGTEEAKALMDAMRRSLRGQEATVITFFPGQGRSLRRLVVGEGGETIFASAELTDSKIACAKGLSPGEELDGRFVERMERPQRLFVMGAGDDAKPVVELASMLGWSVIVADGRANLLRESRFPRAERLARVNEDTRLEEDLEIDGRDAAVIMTHSYEQDRSLLAKLLPLPLRYLGLLGSRHRSSLLVSEAALLCGRSVASCCERLFAPVGMDLGGDGPELIALAIVAEVQAVCAGRLGSSLRLDSSDVAEQISKGGASRYLQTECASLAG